VNIGHELRVNNAFIALIRKRGCQQQKNKTYRVILPKVDVQIRQLLPGNEFTWSAIDSLSGQLQSPFKFPFRPQKIALSVKQCVRLRCFMHSGCHDLYSFHLLICRKQSSASTDSSQRGTRTHPNITPGKQRIHLRLSDSQLFKQIRSLLPPPTVAKIFHDTSCEVIRDNSGDLNLRIGTHLPTWCRNISNQVKVKLYVRTFWKQNFSGLQEAEFTFWGRDRIKLAIRVKKVCWIIGVENGTK
jgi:hypothetical protein